MSSQFYEFPVQGAVAERPRGDADAADLLIQYLEQLGVEYVFGVPGGAIEPLYNALARSARRGGPRAVVARHESGAAFMADGYARETGRLGVCCATTGPGATNLLTGIACAYENEVPVLAITAQTALPTFGRGAFQESSSAGIDIVGMFEHCTRYNTLVTHGAQFERAVLSAIRSCFQQPNGPAHLSLPMDILRAPAEVSAPTVDLPQLLRRRAPVDPAAVGELYHLVDAARGIALLVGPGCAEAVGSALELAMLMDAPVVTTPQGKGLVSPYHPQFRGVFGFAGHASALQALTDPAVDLVIAIGTSLDEFATAGWNQALLNGRLVHVDASEEHFHRSHMARLHVCGDPAGIFESLLSRLYFERYPGSQRLAPDRRRWRDEAAPPFTEPNGEPRRPKRRLDPGRRLTLEQEAKFRDGSTPIKPQRLMHELSRMFPIATRFLPDSGNSVAWSVHYLHPFDRRIAGSRPNGSSLFRTSLHFAPMGWAIGGAIGTALGRRGTPVVCITGDGSLLMNGQELTVAVSEGLPVIFIVLNDAALGMVKHGQRLAGAERIGFEIAPVDFCAFARAMGADAHVIRSPEDLLALDVDAICARPGPTLLDVHIDVEEVPPMGARMKVLESAQ